MYEKIEQLQESLKNEGIDFLFLNNPVNIKYLINYANDPHERIMALVIFPEAAPFLFAPALDVEWALSNTTNLEVFGYTDEENPWEKINNIIRERISQTDHIGIEKDFLTVERYEFLQELLAFTTTTNAAPIIDRMRLIKADDEVEKMLKAGDLAELAVQKGIECLATGVTEADVAKQIDQYIQSLGYEMSFETIVLFGANAANPHGVPGKTTLQAESFVLFDLGCLYEGYCSDMTRTVYYGKAPSNEVQRVYNTVREAHHTAIEKISTDLTAAQLDKVARDVIDTAGYGSYFIHRLGHGLGQSVHEFPSISSTNDMQLEEGMCFSIEPGIYIPNSIGVRVEDCVTIKNGKALKFTNSDTAMRLVEPKTK